MLRVGMVGCGNRGAGHATKLKAIAAVELVGVCDLIHERADRLAAAHGVAAFYDYIPEESCEQHSVRCILDGREPLVTAQRARAVLRLVLAAQASARCGKSVALAATAG